MLPLIPAGRRMFVAALVALFPSLLAATPVLQRTSPWQSEGGASSLVEDAMLRVVDDQGRAWISTHETPRGAATPPHLVYFDGVRQQIPGDGLNGHVDRLFVDARQGGVVAQGRFDRSGSRSVRGLAHWNGGVWTEVAGGFPADALITAMAMDAMSGDLFVAGRFTTSAGVRIDGIARWTAASGQWAALPEAPFAPDHLAWDADVQALVAADALFDQVSVFVGGRWETPRLDNGDTVNFREISDLVAVPGQGVYVASQSRAFGPPSTFPGPALHRVRGATIVIDRRVSGFFEQFSWDRSRNQLVICCGRANGMPDENLALTVTPSSVAMLPALFPGQPGWEAVRVAAGGGRTVAIYGRAEVLELATLGATGWTVAANGTAIRYGAPTWNASTRELFVRALGGPPNVAVRAGGRWSAIELPESHAQVSVVRAAGVDGTVIAGQVTSDQMFVGRWQNGAWSERLVGPDGFTTVLGLNDAVWDAARSRYVLAGRFVVQEANGSRNYDLAEVDASGWRPLDVGIPADANYGRVFGLEVGGCPGGILVFGDLPQWGGEPAGGVGCLVGRLPTPVRALPENPVYATTAGRHPGERYFSLPSGVLRRDATGDRFIGRVTGSAGVVRQLATDDDTGGVIATGSFLAIEGVAANSVARLTRFGWVPVRGLLPHGEPISTWIPEERRLVAGSIAGAPLFEGLASALASARINLPPAISSVGSVTGQPRVGETLVHGSATAVDGDGDPITISRRWLRDGVAIPGATSASYTVVRADRGSRLTVEVTATDGEEIDRLQSDPLAIVNRSPSAGAGRAAGMEGEGMVVSLASFTPVPVDPDGDPLELGIIDLPAGWRSERLDPAGRALFPPPGFSGNARLGMSVCDDLQACTATTVEVTVAPRLLARADRFIVPWGAREARLDVLGNDIVVAARLARGRLSIVDGPTSGQASVDTRGTPDDASDDQLVFIPAANIAAEARVRYRVCEADARVCSDAEVEVRTDAFEGTPVAISTTRDRGHHDFRLHGLAGRSGLRLEATGWARTMQRTLDVQADVSPSNPWDGSGAAVVTGMASVAAGGRVDLQVLAVAAADADVDLYLGVDRNGDGRATSDELACASLTRGGTERCTLRRSGVAGTELRYWVLLQAPSASIRVRLDVNDLAAATANGNLAVTAGARTLPDGILNARAVWNDPTLLPGDTRVASLVLRDADGQALGETLVNLQRAEGEPVAYALRPDEPYRLDLAARGTHSKLYIDVPPGVQRLSVEIESDVSVELRAASMPPLVPDIGIPAIPAAPAAAAGHPTVSVREGRAILAVDRPSAGRWFLVPTNPTAGRAALVLTPRLSSSVPSPIRPGGYFNPARSGSGLFVYPADTEAAALWYTYDEAGRPTWYYLQGPRASVAMGWSGRLFRSTWNGAGNRLVDVGRGSLMPDGSGGVTFSYSLDGQSGSEAYAWFGGGCPQRNRTDFNISGHWFDPARAGSGYSVQLFPDYEFYLMFVYDDLGQPRFLVAEGSGIGADVREIPIQQTRGACPLCAYGAPRPRLDVGRLKRSFDGRSLVELDVRLGLADGLGGRWDVIDRVIPLAGPDSLQGCTAP